jgi:RimJ/RimL family protein N-acetyltransferase
MRAARRAWNDGRMGWVTTGDAAGFLEEAGSFLRAERARNTVLLTVAESARLRPPAYAPDQADNAGQASQDKRPLFGWWTAGDGAVGGAFLHTPPFPVLLSPVPRAVAAELAATTLAGRPLAGVNAYDDVATAFAAAWADGTGGQVNVHRRMRLYRLDGLVWPDPAPAGAPRTAVDDDAALLTEWVTAFADEVHETESADHAAAVRERLSYGGLTLWETGEGPVSLAGFTRQVAGMVRIGPVYTPPGLRGHGYASAATAEVSRAALAAGADEVLLYTDLANPVSNSVYQRIGYREVEDRVVLAFSKQ